MKARFRPAAIAGVGGEWANRNGVGGKRVKINQFVALIVGIICLSTGAQAMAQMALTSAAISQGLALTTYASNFTPNSGGSHIGPIGLAWTPNGNVLVTTNPGTLVVLPNDADGQNASSPLSTVSYVNHGGISLAQMAGNIYMTDQANGNIDVLNNNGTLNHIAFTGVTDATEVVADPNNDHLYVTENVPNVVVDINLNSDSFTNFSTPTAPNGICITPNGSVLYVSANDHILGYNTGNRAEIYDSGDVGAITGIALGSGVENGDVIANLTNGTLISVNLATDVSTLLASGGTRGDELTVDPTNGSLMVTQDTTVLRMTGATSVPEPGSATIWFGAAAALICRRPNRRRAS
jgi:hypothetical protein